MDDTDKSDWIAVHRRILESAVGSEDELLGLFTRVLLCVNWKAGQFKGFHVQPGQMLFAWRRLRERLYPNAVDGPSKNTIEKRLRCLEALGVLKIQPHESRRFSVLTVPNWSKYQPKTVYQKMGTDSGRTYPKSGTVTAELSPESGTVLGTVPGTVLGTDRRRNNKANKSSSASEEAQRIFKLWNATANQHADVLSIALKLTDDRLQKIATRLKDPQWFSHYQQALAMLPLPASPGKDWQPNLDWMIANGRNVIAVLERKYDWRGQQDRNPQPAKPLTAIPRGA